MLLPLPLLFLLASAPFTVLSSPVEPLTAVDVTRESFSNRVLLIRHGEKPRDKSEGLSRLGEKRAQCLRDVFGKDSKHNIGLIMAENFNPRSEKRIRPYLTVNPLARDLGMEVNLSCEVDDAECVRRVVSAFTKKSTKDVLICWKHSMLPVLARALGSRTDEQYPVDRFDIMWIMKRKRIIAKASERCEGLDDHHGKSRHDPDLEIEDVSGDDIDADDFDLEWLIDQVGEDQQILGD